MVFRWGGWTERDYWNHSRAENCSQSGSTTTRLNKIQQDPQQEHNEKIALEDGQLAKLTLSGEYCVLSRCPVTFHKPESQWFIPTEPQDS